MSDTIGGGTQTIVVSGAGGGGGGTAKAHAAGGGISPAKPGYAVVIAQNLGDQCTLSFQFNFMHGATAADMNAELDKITGVFERQAARAGLKSKYDELKAQKLVAEVITDDIVRMQGQLANIAEAGKDANRRNPVNTQQITQNVEAQKEALKKTQRVVAELEKIIGDMEKKAA